MHLISFDAVVRCLQTTIGDSLYSREMPFFIIIRPVGIHTFLSHQIVRVQMLSLPSCHFPFLPICTSRQQCGQAAYAEIQYSCVVRSHSLLLTSEKCRTTSLDILLVQVKTLTNLLFLLLPLKVSFYIDWYGRWLGAWADWQKQQNCWSAFEWTPKEDLCDYL